MKKIGLFLDVKPHAGGIFQYSQTIVGAFDALPSSEYEKIVVYTDLRWEPILRKYPLSCKPVSSQAVHSLLINIWCLLPLSIRFWRDVAFYFHPVAKMLVREKCDLWIFPAQDVWSYMAPVQALTTVHDLMHRYERRFSEVSGRGRFHVRERRFNNICHWSKGIVVDSEMGKEHVRESYDVPIGKIFVLPYIPPKYIENSRPEQGLSTVHKLPKKYLFYPAQFWEHKNHVRLISAVAKVRTEYPDVALVLVGSKKNAYSKVMKLVHKLGLNDCVCVVGYVPDRDLSELYRRARALIMPTFFGPTNIPPLEAFVLGCPVAVSNIYGMREQLRDAALFFDPNSVEEITATIKRLWSDDALCNRLAYRGKKRARIWSVNQFNRGYETIIQANL